MPVNMHSSSDLTRFIEAAGESAHIDAKGPMRGTAFTVGEITYLYTNGFLTAQGRYPHGHVPCALQVADHVGDTAKRDLLREIMALTKMNWNSANMAGLMPITLRFSRLVGDVLREVAADREPQPKYKFYM